MNSTLASSLLALALLSTPVLAQNNFEGLDLSDDAAKKPADKKDAPKKEKEKPKDELDFSKPASDEKDDSRKPLVKKDDGPAVERDITQDDRVKSVQRKLYVKRGRFELAPSVILNVNDAYYSKVGGSIRAAFYPADTLAISARFMLMQTLPTDDVRTAKRNLQSRIFFSVPQWAAMADVEWSPLYGKVSFFNSILHIDGYLAAGGGIVYTQTSARLDDAKKPEGPRPAFDLGLGLRFVAKDFFAFNLGLINTTYVEAPLGTTKGITQNMLMVHAGVSFFFPLKSTFREAE